jgi:Ni/Co efflux regulator RcnB
MKQSAHLAVSLVKEHLMKSKLVLCAAVTALLAMTGSSAVAQDRNRASHDKFDDHDQQVTRDWYNQHQSHPPAGFRQSDRLSPEEEGRLREGEKLDNGFRNRMHPIPSDLGRRLPPPPPRHKYVSVGGHVVLMDNNFQIKSVIRLH